MADCDDNCVNTPNPGQEDCDANGVGDACAAEPDCNTNGVPDSCDITGGGSVDGNGNGVPDECEAADVINLATADFLTDAGTVAGSYLDTHAQDDVYEALTEQQSGGKPSRRHSLLSHTLTFSIAAGSTYTFHVDAYHTVNAEGDDFAFSYSRDNVNYIPMLVVTKTADNDGLQAYAFQEDVAGLLYVRVEDTDQTQGSKVLDTLFVDEMFVRTSNGGGGDTVPPAAPAGLSATPGDGVVNLNWADNTEPDLAGYNIYRSTTSGGPYTQINGALTATSDYADGAVTNGTTYYYVVTALNAAANESADSNEASATPNVSPDATTMHVSSIVLASQNVGGGNKQGQATVTVLDDLGNPVASADVTGSFTGDFNEPVAATTDANGVAVLSTTTTSRGGISFVFCVDGVTHATLTYDSAVNAETCDAF